jgi:hypothetical protein
MCAMKLYEIPEGKVVYRHDLLEQNTVAIGAVTFPFTNEAEAKLLYEAATFFGPGEYRIPDNETDARLALDDWLAHKKELDEYFWKRAKRRSDREEFQEGMIEEFWNLYRMYRRGHYKPIGDPKAPLHKITVEPKSDDENAVIEFGRIPRGRYAPRQLETA